MLGRFIIKVAGAGEPRLIIVIMLVALVTIAASAWITWQLIDGNRSTPAATQSVAVQSPVSIGGPFSLTNHKGEAVTDATFRDRYMLIFFGYGYCPDVCPTELANMATAMDYLGPAADKVQRHFNQIPHPLEMFGQPVKHV